MTLSPIAVRVLAQQAMQVRIARRICNQCHAAVRFDDRTGQWDHEASDAALRRCMRPILPAS